MQGYDSYHMDTDIQIGAADQTFNMQAGRVLQKELRNKESFILVTDYLIGMDGRKMSKSWGNAIWVEDLPNEIFGKLMSIPDKQVISYMELATNTPMDKIGETEKNLKSGKINPINAKKELAYTVVEELHSLDDAKSARAYFEKTFQESQPEYKTEWTFSGNATITDMVSDIVGSKSEAKRLISQKAVDIGGITVLDPNIALEGGEKIKIGKKEFRKVIKK
jgi:tyrosyl-tRNA synthetase